MKSIPVISACLLLGGSVVAQAGETDIPMNDTEACMKGRMAEFGQYIGNWNIEDWQLSPDGKEWKKGAGARWNFVCIGDGTAVQDFWMPNDGGVGTNLRTYNSKLELWDIAWAITAVPGFAHIQAKRSENGSIVMHYKSPVPDPARRITFFPPDEKGWNWKLEFSSDGGLSWREVYRIKATRSD